MFPEENRITPEQYLVLERDSDIRNEYYAGEIFAMAGAGREHNQISANIVRILGNQLLERPCSVFSSDMKVKIQELEKYTYPDIVIACEQEEYEDENNDVLLNPLVIIEILSDSTEAYDRGDKFAHYQIISSFTEYLLVSQYFCRVEKFLRRRDDSWIYTKYHSMEDAVKIEAVNCDLPVAEVYRKVNLCTHQRKPDHPAT